MSGRTIYEDDCVRVIATGRRCDAGGLMSEAVRRIEYEHVEDPAHVYRRHDFGPDVRMIALPGLRAALIVGAAGQKLVRDY